MQIKLLRLIENGEYYPVGSDNPRRCQTRFVLSTIAISRRGEYGGFRKDLSVP